MRWLRANSVTAKQKDYPKAVSLSGLSQLGSAAAADVFHCGVRSCIFCTELVNELPRLRRRRHFGRCGFTGGSGWRQLVVASKPRTGLGYRLALRRLGDRGLAK